MNESVIILFNQNMSSTQSSLRAKNTSLTVCLKGWQSWPFCRGEEGGRGEG